MMTGPLELLASLALTMAPIAQSDAPEVRGAVILTRQDFAELVQDVDEMVAQGSLLRASDGLSALARTNVAFDALSADFLGARLGDAFEKLATLRMQLAGADALGVDPVRIDVQAGDRWVRSLRVSGATLSSDGVRVRFRSVLPWAEHAGSSVTSRLWLSPPGAVMEVPAPVRFDARGYAVSSELEVEPAAFMMLETREPALELGGRRLAHGGLRIVPIKTSATAELRERWGTVRAHVEDEGALRAFESRLSLDWEAPSPERSREFLLDPERYEAELRADLAMLERGEDPYRSRQGDHWRTFAHGRRDLAARFYLPESAPEESISLVVAFHGAGGDENFFFELAGDGHLKRLADRHGCLLVAPFTPDFLWSAKAFDALLAGISADYPIDPERVFVLGHSLGAGATARLGSERPDAIAGACCIAGIGRLGAKIPPTLVVQGERDRIVPARAVELAVEAADGSDVEYVELEDQGHTLLLPAALDLAFARWFDGPR